MGIQNDKENKENKEAKIPDLKIQQAIVRGR